MKTRTSPDHQSERGAILIFMALALVPLILLLALAVDTTRLSASHSQLREVAGFSALAAMKAYGDADTTLTYGEKLEAAFVAAEETMERESNRLIGRQFEGPTPSAKFRDPIGVTSEDRSYPNDDDVNGVVRAGNWWFTEPIDPNTGAQDCAGWLQDQIDRTVGPMDSKCPCPTVSGTAEWRGACFERNDDTADTAGAFEIELFTRETSPIKTIFAAIGGADSFDLATAAWATKVPRRGVFIIDLSKSMTFDTHLDVGSNRTDYAFKLRNRNCNAANDYTNFCINSECTTSNCTGPGERRGGPDFNQCGMFSATQDAFFRRGSYSTGYQYLQPVRPASAFPEWQHFKDDYQCVDVDIAGSTESYLIDSDGLLSGGPANRPHLLSPGSDTYQGAEPLTAVLGGINRALQVVYDRALAGDEIGVVFVDEEILDSRKYPDDGLTTPGTTFFEDLMKISDVDIANTSAGKGESGHPLFGTNYSDNLAQRLKSVIFPRLIDWRTVNTDLPRALVEGVNMLNSQARVGSQADNYVAIFTDGLSNCSHRAPGSGGGPNFQPNPFLAHDNFVIGPDVNGYFRMPSGPQFRCPHNIRPSPSDPVAERVRNFNNHLVSLQEAATIVAGKVNEADSPDYDLPSDFRSYVDRGYEVHVFLTGSKVQPNNLVRPAKRDSNGNPNGCMTQEEAVNSNYPYAYGGDPLPDTDPANATYDDAGSQGDVYIQNTELDPAGYQHYPNQALYNTLVAPTGGIWAPVRPPCDPALAPGGALTQTQCEDGDLVERLDQHCDDAVTAHGDPMTPNPDISVVDVPGIIENGALICDPFCRSTAESVGDNVEQIYANNPFILVESAFRREDVD